MNFAYLSLAVLALTAPVAAAVADFSFVHPGLLHGREDVARIRAAVAARQEPTFAGYEAMRRHPGSQLTYRLRGPAEEIGRAPSVFFNEFDQDAAAAFQCAMLWCATGDRAYAEKSRAIVNAWSATLQRVSGADAALMAGLGPFKLINAAEILRHTGTGWTEAESRQCERMLREAIYPTIKDFALYANGNWDTACLKTMMALGVFTNDRAMYERAVRFYIGGAGNGRLTYYIINDDGQCQESGRDQPHTMLGMGHLAEASEIAWHQGLDLYAQADNRLLKGFEYTARYFLDEPVPFAPWLDRTGKYRHTRISTVGKGKYRPVFELVWNHYENRAGLPAPFTKKLAGSHRPEGGAVNGDHPGFGTFLFSRPPATAGSAQITTRPAAPAGLIATGRPDRVTLAWVAPIGAVTYHVKRAGRSEAFTVIGHEVASAGYIDRNVRPGEWVRYVVAAANAVGESDDSFPAAVCAGLPLPWSYQDVGNVSVPGSTGYDGQVFTLEGAGTDIGGANDQFQFAGVHMAGDGTITARFVPQVSSQHSTFGLMMRGDRSPDSASVGLLFTADLSRESERPAWSVLLVARAAPARNTATVATASISAPQATWGRLMEPCWLRLSREGEVFTATISPDGKTWRNVGSARILLDKNVLVGLAACSRLTTVTTTVMFDHVSVPGWNEP